jgi:hypothetical protein
MRGWEEDGMLTAQYVPPPSPQQTLPEGIQLESQGTMPVLQLQGPWPGEQELDTLVAV